LKFSDDETSDVIVRTAPVPHAGPAAGGNLACLLRVVRCSSLFSVLDLLTFSAATLPLLPSTVFQNLSAPRRDDPTQVHEHDCNADPNREAPKPRSSPQS
jgi:hypothetical protein